MERDRLVIFISKLISHKKNVRDLLDAGGIRILIDLLTFAHLHTSRAVIPTQTNVIEAGPNMEYIQEKEWYYRKGEKNESCGPITFKEVSHEFF